METVLRDLADGLVAAGDRVTVLCAAGDLRGTDDALGGVRVVRSPSLGKLLSQPLTPLFPVTLHRLARDADLIHLHMPNPVAEASVLAAAAGRPIVVTYHADIIRQWFLRPAYAPVRNAVLRAARRIVVPTENHINYSEVLPAYRPKCTVVPFGISPGRYALDDDSRRLADELRRRHPRCVLFVGRLVYYKGLDVLVQAMRDVDGHLIIAGDGPLRQAVETWIAAAGVGDRVTLVGGAPQNELNAYFDACQLLVLPSASRSEGFGMTLLEGMLFGKPLVTARIPSGVQLVNEDERTGLQVPPGDSQALASAVNRLLRDAALRERLGTAGRERVRTRFSLQRMVDGYREVYASP
jgi:rhamnosyl/mannosyltransferase